MSLSAFLDMLNQEFLPELPRLSPHLPGWLPKLESKLEEVQRQLGSDEFRSHADVAVDELSRLFEERQEELRGFVNSYRRRLENCGPPKAPKAVTAVVKSDGQPDYLPENTTLTEKLSYAIDALGENRSRPADAAEESAPLGKEQQ